MPELLATCCPGLEDILTAEIEQRLSTPARTARGEARFHGAVGEALQLRCADNVYTLLGETPAGPHRASLPALGQALAALPVRERCAQAGIALPGLRSHVSASRRGKHSFSRFEAAAAALAALCPALGCIPGTAEAHDVAFRLDVDGNRATLSVKLTDAAFRFRGQRAFSAAAIRPTIAHALVRLSQPRDSDVFLDPFCGSGTILCERLSLPHKAVLGGDWDAQALTAAAQNTSGQAQLAQWDAGALPLESASVDAIVTNPPWGNQIAVQDSAALYHAFLREAQRVLIPGGRLVVLSDRAEDMDAAAKKCGIALPQPLTLSLHGSLCKIWTFFID